VTPQEQTHQLLRDLPRAGNLSLLCAPGCEQRGNCNIEEGRCECPFGWTGPACEKAVFPACKVLESSQEVGATLNVEVKLCTGLQACSACCLVAVKAAAKLRPRGRRTRPAPPPLAACAAQLFCKERALMSCECIRQCHAHYCKPLEKLPWVYDCTNFRAPHGGPPGRGGLGRVPRLWQSFAWRSWLAWLLWLAGRGP
jgi:hypothetical protein